MKLAQEIVNGLFWGGLAWVFLWVLACEIGQGLARRRKRIEAEDMRRYLQGLEDMEAR